MRRWSDAGTRVRRSRHGYSAEEPPQTRGLVLVDGVDGEIVAHFVEDNPEDWSDLPARERRGLTP